MKKTENTKARRSAATVESDYVTNRVLTVFGGGILLMAFATYLKNGLSYASSFPMSFQIAQGGIWVGIILAVLGLVLNGMQLTRGTYRAQTLFNGTGLLMLGALLSLVCYLLVGYDPEQALRILYVIIPVCAILYLVYSVYPREFFTLAAMMTSVAVLLWLIAKSIGSNSLSGASLWFLALGLVLCVGLEGLFLAVRKKRGKLTMGKLDLQVFGPQTSHALVVTVALCSALLLLAAFFLAGSVGLYAMFALVGSLFVLAVYYTVKMM